MPSDPHDTGVKSKLTTTHLLYLHGFRSSPQSAKARQVAQWMRTHRPDVTWWCPQLPPSPQQAMALLTDGTTDWPTSSSAVIGSSLGGFYATALAERTGWPTVLLNPAVDPARDLAKYMGETNACHSDDPFFLRPEFVAQLQSLTVAAITHPERTLAVIAKGDEVLNWREMRSRYTGCNIKLLEGGDHALSDFDAQLPEVLAFLQLTSE